MSMMSVSGCTDIIPMAFCSSASKACDASPPAAAATAVTFDRTADGSANHAADRAAENASRDLSNRSEYTHDEFSFAQLVAPPVDLSGAIRGVECDRAIAGCRSRPMNRPCDLPVAADLTTQTL